MKAEVNRSAGELIVTLDTAGLPFTASDKSLKANLPGSAGDISEGILGMLAEPPAPGDPVRVRVVRVRLVRVEVVAETILELGGTREIYA